MSAAAEARRGSRPGPRVGVSKAADIPWRFWLAEDPTVSPYRRVPFRARVEPRKHTASIVPRVPE